MTPDDTRRLELAYAAFRSAREHEVDAFDARGVARRLRQSRTRRAPASAVVGVLVLALAGLAYAAATHSRGSRSERLESNPGVFAAPAGALLGTSARHSARRIAEAVAVTADPNGALTGGELAHASSRGAHAPSRGAHAPSRGAHAPSKAHGRQYDGGQSDSRRQSDVGWAEVASAMQSGDTEHALSALGRLATKGDARTRSKAQLGIASVELSRGNCIAVRRIVSSVMAAHPPEDALSRRARQLLAPCKAPAQGR